MLKRLLDDKKQDKYDKRLAEKSHALKESVEQTRKDIQRRFNEIEQVFTQIETQVNQQNYQFEFKMDLNDIKQENEHLMQMFNEMQKNYESELAKIKAEVREEVDNEFKLIEDEVNKLVRRHTQNQVDQIQDLILNLNIS